jgi:hypothetical protein
MRVLEKQIGNNAFATRRRRIAFKPNLFHTPLLRLLTEAGN